MAATLVACASNEPDGFRSGSLGGAFTAGACAFASPQLNNPQAIECGSVAVPLRHQGDVTLPSGTAGLSIALAVLRQNPQGARSQHALIILRGGPGEPLLNDLAALLRGWSVLLQTPHDVIALDMRGVGQSGSTPTCSSAGSLGTDLSIDNCADQLRRQRFDLSAISAEQAAADLELIRRALGYQRLLLYGESYGSLVAQVYLRDFPASVDRLVLDGPLPLGINRHVEGVPGTWQAMQRTLEACGQQSPCNRLPNLWQRYRAALVALRQRPFVVQEARARTPALVFNHRDLWRTFSRGLDSASRAAALPAFIDVVASAVENDPVADALLRQFWQPQAGTQSLPNDALNLAHLLYDCSSLSPGSFLEGRLRGVDEAVRDASLPQRAFYQSACAALQAYGVVPFDLQPGTAKAPMLVISSPYESATPLSFGQLLVQRHAGASLLASPTLGHVSLGRHPCVNEATLNFLLGQQSVNACDAKELPRFDAPQPTLTSTALADILEGSGLATQISGNAGDGGGWDVRVDAGEPPAGRDAAASR